MQIAGAASGALAVAAEEGEKSAAPVNPLSAVFALVHGAVHDLAEDIAGSPGYWTAADETGWHELGKSLSLCTPAYTGMERKCYRKFQSRVPDNTT